MFKAMLALGRSWTSVRSCVGGLLSTSAVKGGSQWPGPSPQWAGQVRGLSIEWGLKKQLLVVLPREQAPHEAQEGMRLAETWAGEQCPSVHVGPRRGGRVLPSTFFGRGVVASLASHCLHLQPDRVFVNAELSSVQQRNLEEAIGVPILDRVGLIIDIFAQRATTAEAHLQVEMAQLEYRSSRLVRGASAAAGLRAGFGDAAASEVVSARERGRSGSASGGLGGAGGGGEAELQLQRSRIRARMKLLRQRLEEVKKTRRLLRDGRRRVGVPIVAVVGYTNTGKSSLVTALSRQHVEARDRLFETLDPTLRRAQLPSGAAVLLSDTVGFISGLPTQLVRAFRATLEEVTHADLLLHVLDASSPQVMEQRKVVLEVLKSLGMTGSAVTERLIEVWNKVDLVQEAPRREAAAVAEPRVAAAQVAASLQADLQEGALDDVPAFALPQHSLALGVPQEGGSGPGGGAAGGKDGGPMTFYGEVVERDDSEWDTLEGSGHVSPEGEIADEDGSRDCAVRGGMAEHNGHGLDHDYWANERGKRVLWVERDGNAARGGPPGDAGLGGGEEGAAEEYAEFPGEHPKQGPRPKGGPVRVLTSVRTGLGLRTLQLELDRLIQEQGLVRAPVSL